MKRKTVDENAIGEDSFLDTVANLVGILIILVVIIGTKTSIDAQAYGEQVAARDITEQLEDPAIEVVRLRTALHESNKQLAQHEFEVDLRRLERDKLLEHVALARLEVEEQTGQMDAQQKAQFERTQLIETLQTRLKEVNEHAGTNEETKRPTIVLEHLPTPMAKTVFGREMHVRIRNGLVTVIPWDRLVKALKDHVPLAARRNASRKTLEDTLGPIDGFLLKYRMNSVPGGFELDRFELETMPDNRGEPLTESLAEHGRLRLEMASRNPAETVVTVWVYPDSFDEFRQLKAAMFDEGFLCAARPLPNGMPIGASPRGSRSAAQ